MRGPACLASGPGGAPRTYRAGDRFFIPAGVRHSAVVSAGYRAVMVFNSPDRYKAKGI